MNGILYLTSHDYELRRSDDGELLCLRSDVRGLTLVLFYSHECQYCQALLLEYKQIPFSISGCRIAMINIQKKENSDIVDKSSNTLFPLTHVPDIVLFVDSVPYAQYSGEYTIESIRDFVFQINNHVQKTTFLDEHAAVAPSASQRQQQQQPSSQRQTRPVVDPNKNTTTMGRSPDAQNVDKKDEVTTTTIPPYTVGHPKNTAQRGKDSYTSFTQAYSVVPTAT